MGLKEVARKHMAIVAAAFASAGLPLDYYPKDEENRELWQYDGFDYGKDILVQFYVGTNRAAIPTIFGDTDIAGTTYDLTCCAENWMTDFGEKAIKAISEGNAPF